MPRYKPTTALDAYDCHKDHGHRRLIRAIMIAMEMIEREKTAITYEAACIRLRRSMHTIKSLLKQGILEDAPAHGIYGFVTTESVDRAVKYLRALQEERDASVLANPKRGGDPTKNRRIRTTLDPFGAEKTVDLGDLRTYSAKDFDNQAD